MIEPREFIDLVWRGRDARARLARAVLTPVETLYRVAVAARSELYDRGIASAYSFSVPILSVGNLTVGGTGKTPISAWFASQFLQRGVPPAIVLRGYGGDETLVHQRLNPDIPVVASADRVRGIRAAIVEGASVVILDDAFQHRRAERDADVVLINADAWTGSVRMLPAGPWREPLAAASRASLVIITRKTAEASAVDQILTSVRRAAPTVPTAVVRLVPGELRSTSTGASLPLQAIESADLTAVAAIAHPESFFKQLTDLGAIVRPHSFPDHHAFTRGEVRDICAAAQSSDFVVCTLKDAVKLEGMWPAEGGSLWYVSQRLLIEDGRQNLERVVDGLLLIGSEEISKKR